MQQRLLQQQEQQHQEEGEGEREGGEEHSAADEEGSQLTLNQQQEIDELMASMPPESKQLDLIILSVGRCMHMQLSGLSKVVHSLNCLSDQV